MINIDVSWAMNDSGSDRAQVLGVPVSRGGRTLAMSAHFATTTAHGVLATGRPRWLELHRTRLLLRQTHTRLVPGTRVRRRGHHPVIRRVIDKLVLIIHSAPIVDSTHRLRRGVCVHRLLHITPIVLQRR